MKKLSYILCMAIVAVFIISCSDDNIKVNELDGLKLVTTLSNTTHRIEIYTVTGSILTGYNDIYFQIKNLDESLIENASVSWTPTMYMSGMSHSCPASSVAKMENSKSTYTGFIVFQMASNDTEYWELSINYSIDGTAYDATEKIQVTAAPKRVIESFQGSDEKRYVLALVEPSTPRVAVNDMKAVLYEMETMTSFVPVDGFTIKIDPRMPGMNNHTSPNNVSLTQSGGTMYQGKLSLTMTGYWKINLQLLNEEDDVLKGEAVTEVNESSSIYFELEF